MLRLGDRTYARRMVGERDVPWRAATKVRSPVRTSACDMEEEDRARWMAARRFGLLVSLLNAMHYFVTHVCMYGEIWLRLREVGQTIARLTAAVSDAWQTNVASWLFLA